MREFSDLNVGLCGDKIMFIYYEEFEDKWVVSSSTEEHCSNSNGDWKLIDW